MPILKKTEMNKLISLFNVCSYHQEIIFLNFNYFKTRFTSKTRRKGPPLSFTSNDVPPNLIVGSCILKCGDLEPGNHAFPPPLKNQTYQIQIVKWLKSGLGPPSPSHKIIPWIHSSGKIPDLCLCFTLKFISFIYTLHQLK